MDAPPTRRVVAIVQSNYIPWKGYFDLINRADTFILLDDVQYTRRDWRNRNQIKTRAGLRWLTIPVQVKGNYFQSIRDTRVSDLAWPRRHWQSIAHSYAAAPYFREYRDWLEDLFLGTTEEHLSDVNSRFLTAIGGFLGIATEITWSSSYRLVPGKSERLLALCQQAGATTYLSGPAAQAYMDEALFRQHGIEVEYLDYTGYPEYPQLYPPFAHNVTVLDLLLNVGPAARDYLKSF